MKRLITIGALTLCVLLLFSGCGSQKLAERFDQSKVIETAKNAVTLLNQEDYEAFTALLDESTKASLTVDTLKTALAQVKPDSGAFSSFTAEKAIGQKDKSGKDCAVIQLAAKYDKQDVIYTISLNSDLKIIGFYLK